MLDEPLPPGTGWFFTLGSVLLALLSIQLLTGAFLTLYYAASPDHAYDSVRFINTVRFGAIVRGLHHYGASFIVIAMVAHMLRVIAFGSYKPPREVTWLSGLALLGLILGFALTGYLLPWDQRAVLGDGRHHQHLEADAAGRRNGRRRSSRRFDHWRLDSHTVVLRRT